MTNQYSQSMKRFLIIGAVLVLSLLITATVLAALPPDTTIADFQSGTVGSCYVAPSAWDGNVDGEVILSPTMGEDFSGTVLPSGWYSGTYLPNVDKYPVVGDGFITVEQNYAGVNINYGEGRSLEFEAKFTGSGQYVGFASDTNLNVQPWALFGTFGRSSDLFADTRSAGTLTTQVITGGLGIPHRFKINWTSGSVIYYIDGAAVATHTIDIGLQLHPIIADNPSDPLTSLSVDWLRMGTYSPATCIYTSHVFNANVASPIWMTLTTSTDVPVNTALTFETRSGDTTNPDLTWSAWSLASNGNIASGTNGQYLQYRASLTSTDSLESPHVYSVLPGGQTPTAVVVTSIVGKPETPAPNLFGILLAVGLGLFSLLTFRHFVKKARKTDQ